VSRVHYEIPDELHRRAKAAAALRGVTLKEFLIEALQQAVARDTDQVTG
jgi:predicted HicB family RNase H-like nuclease